MSEWKNNVDSMTLSAGVDVRMGADGVTARQSLGKDPLAAKDTLWPLTTCLPFVLCLLKVSMRFPFF